MIILDSPEIRNWDDFTLKDQKISSISLMKRAAKAFTNYFVSTLGETDDTISIFCGSGNNGGDGIAVAINLRNAFYNVEVFICHISDFSKDNRLMYEELINYKDIGVYNIYKGEDLNNIPVEKIAIDAIFGTGLSRPVLDYWKSLINHINKKAETIFSIDTPSGMFTNQFSDGGIIEADYCGTFQSPKLVHLLPESERYLAKLDIIDIGLSENFKPSYCYQYYIEQSDIDQLLNKRRKHAHKGQFGHALLICGSKGMAGALLLCAKACLRSGAGKLSLAVTEDLNEIAQLGVPEAMTLDVTNINSDFIDSSTFDVVATGCGLNTNAWPSSMLDKLLSNSDKGLILDADALNIIARESWQNRIPANSILSPHIKEFERLFGNSPDSLDRLRKARKKAMELHIYIILKGAYTCTSTPEGKQFFNSTGNPGMATAGSGDVLTGILAGIAAQGYNPLNTCLISVFLHGLAGDMASNKMGETSLIASDIIQFIPNAISQIMNEKN